LPVILFIPSEEKKISTRLPPGAPWPGGVTKRWQANFLTFLKRLLVGRDGNLKYHFTKYLKWKNNKYLSHGYKYFTALL
jgi:hypothetical protein